MAKVDTLQLSDENFVDVGRENIQGLIVSNTHTDDIGFDLILGDPVLSGGTATTDAIFILKSVPISSGSTFVWDDDNVLSGVFDKGGSISVFNTNTNSFTKKDGLTFLLKLEAASTSASVVIRRQ